MSLPRTISVITPTHNRRSSLERLLDALGKQDHPGAALEVVVVADGCTDDTLDFLAGFKTGCFSLKYTEQPGLGAANARNIGAHLAGGEQLIFLDDDIEPSPGLVSAFVRACRDQKDVVIGYLPMELRRDADIYHIQLTWWWEEKYHAMGLPGYRHIFEDLLSGNFSCSRKFFLELGGFNARFRCREDYELGARMIHQGARFQFCREAWGYHRDEVTDQKRSHQRKKLEGFWDVEFARIHPQLIPNLRLRKLIFTGRIWKTRMVIARHLPCLSDLEGAGMLALLRIYAFLRFRGKWFRLDQKLNRLYYMRGVIEASNSYGELRALCVDDVYLQYPVTRLDLGRGVNALEHELDQMFARRVHVFLDGVFVCELYAPPGEESFRGRDLVPLLAEYHVNNLGDALLASSIKNSGI